MVYARLRRVFLGVPKAPYAVYIIIRADIVVPSFYVLDLAHNMVIIVEILCYSRLGGCAYHRLEVLSIKNKVEPRFSTKCLYT